tara:strand:+ start:2565 stop:3857 length:1293 start_codon:yes stop_codon:yes gene_type:complete
MNINFKTKYLSFLFLILTINLLVKIFFFIYFRDLGLQNEWSVMFENLNNYGILSYHLAHTNELPPNSYMPPLYAFMIFLISKINIFQISLVNKVILFQIFINSISVLLIYLTFKNFFKNYYLYLLVAIYAFYPLAIFSSVQISSTTLTMFLLSSFFYFHFIKNNNYYFKFLFYGLFAGLLILIRGEFYLIFFLILVFEIIKNKRLYKKFLFSLIISLIVISPYLKRNFDIFDKLIITQSIGYNLWRGSNELSSVDSIISHNFIYNTSIDPIELKSLSQKEQENLFHVKQKIKNINEDNKKYDLIRDNIFFKEFKTNISNNFFKYLILSSKKLISFLFINFESNYKNYYNPGVIIPEIIISIISFYGFIICILNYRKNYFFINLFSYYALIFSIFFVLPRYKLIVLPILCYFSIIGLKHLIEKLNFKKGTK